MRDRVTVAGCAVDPVTLDQAVDRISGWISAGERRTGVAVNARKLALRRESPEVCTLLETADLNVADGASVQFLARLARSPLPERVPGIEIAERLLERAPQMGWTVALLGGTPAVAARLAGPGRWTHDGYSLDGVVQALAALDPDVLLVGMGSPQQEAFLVQHPRLARFSMGVGGSLDVLAGKAARAPGWTRRVGLEGAWRIASDPRRIPRVVDLFRMWPGRSAPSKTTEGPP